MSMWVNEDKWESMRVNDGQDVKTSRRQDVKMSRRQDVFGCSRCLEQLLSNCETYQRPRTSMRFCYQMLSMRVNDGRHSAKVSEGQESARVSEGQGGSMTVNDG